MTRTEPLHSPGHDVPSGAYRCVCGAKVLDIERGYAPPCSGAPRRVEAVSSPCPECGTVRGRHWTTCAASDPDVIVCRCGMTLPGRAGGEHVACVEVSHDE